MLIEILMAALVVMFASLAGVLFVGKVAREFLTERLSYLVAFSSGVILVTSGALALEVFHIYEDVLWWGLGLILLGYALAWLLGLFLPETHHHHDPTCVHNHGKGARKLMVGDAIHNISDGIILVPAFMVSPALGIAVTVSIFIHEALQEISEFFVLKQAGYTTKRALTLNFAISSTILIGVGLSYFALASHDLEGLLLAISAGFLLHTVVHDLFPKRVNHASTSEFLKHLAVVGCGLALMATVNAALGETHSHGGEHTDEHDHAGEAAGAATEAEHHGDHDHDDDHDHAH